MGILKMGVKWEGLYTRETKRKLRRGNYFHDRKKGKRGDGEKRKRRRQKQTLEPEEQGVEGEGC